MLKSEDSLEVQQAAGVVRDEPDSVGASPLSAHLTLRSYVRQGGGARQGREGREESWVSRTI